MKTIIINSITAPDRVSIRTLRNSYYKIPVPYSGGNIYAKSKRKIFSLQSNYCQFLTDILYDLNYITSEVYNDYRRQWANIQNDNISFEFASIDKSLFIAVNRKDIFLIYQMFYNVFSSLENVLKQLIEVVKSACNYNENRHLKARLESLNNMREKLNSFNLDSPFFQKSNPKKLN